VEYKDFCVTIDCDKVECERVFGARYRYPEFITPNISNYICKGHVKYKVMIVYPYTLFTFAHQEFYDIPVKPRDEDIKFSNEIKDFIDGIVIRSAYDFLYEKDNFVTYLDNVSDGISKAVKLMWLVYQYKPDILLIDDIESVHLHPLRFEKFLNWLLSRNLKGLIFTTNSDVYITLAEMDKNSKFLLLRKDGYMLMDSEEVLDRIDYEDLRYTAVKG